VTTETFNIPSFNEKKIKTEKYLYSLPDINVDKIPAKEKKMKK